MNEFKSVFDDYPDWKDGGRDKPVEIRLEDGTIVRGVMFAVEESPMDEGPEFEVQADDGRRFALTTEMEWRYAAEVTPAPSGGE